MFQVQQQSCAYVYQDLLTLIRRLICEELGETQVDAVINFKDPEYTEENGGFHPVEIAVTREGEIRYITDFSYVGRQPFVELVKNLDFDFQYGLFQQFGRDYPMSEGFELFQLWQHNFLQYYQMGVYEITVQRL